MLTAPCSARAGGEVCWMFRKANVAEVLLTRGTTAHVVAAVAMEVRDPRWVGREYKSVASGECLLTLSAFIDSVAQCYFCVVVV